MQVKREAHAAWASGEKKGETREWLRSRGAKQPARACVP